MRRIVSIALMLTFSLTLIAPLLASEADANLPPCCRRNGKHHCMMRSMERRGDKENSFTSVSEKCPCLPASACAVPPLSYKAEAGKQFYAEGIRYLSCAPQTEAHCRISSLPSHPKRGPPLA
ncbi:MAG: hypothetical protein ABSG00_10215 [Terracidiphilus sp.]|jgi:hypothetical protein